MHDCVECVRPLELVKCCTNTTTQDEEKRYGIYFCDTCQAHYLIVEWDQTHQFSSDYLEYAIPITSQQLEQLCTYLAKPDEFGKKQLAEFELANKERKIIIKDRHYDQW